MRFRRTFVQPIIDEEPQQVIVGAGFTALYLSGQSGAITLTDIS